MKINSNMQALQASGILLKNEGAFSKSSARLSSGYKINISRDDPVGMAISNVMDAKASSLKKANINSTSGVSVVQTADGALAEMRDIIHRIKELSIHSANGTNTNEDRLAMQAEIDQLTAEYDRIVERTEYNGQKLLNGNLGVKGSTYLKEPPEHDPEIKYYGAGTIGTYITDSADISKIASRYTFTLNEETGKLSINDIPYEWSDFASGSKTLAGDPIEEGDYTLNIDGVEVILTVLDGSTQDQIGQSIDGLSVDVNYKAPTPEEIEELLKQWEEGTLDITVPEGSTAESEIIKIFTSRYFSNDETNLVRPDEEDNFRKNDDTGLSVADYNNHIMEKTGRTLRIEDDANGIPQVVEFTDFPYEGDDCKFTTDPLSKTITYTDKDGNELVLEYTDDLVKGKDIYLDVISKGQMVIQVGNTSGQEIIITIPDCGFKSMGIGKFDVTTAEEAKKTMGKCDRALSYLSRVSTRIGAIQNRFEANISNLNVSEENLIDSFSTLRDTNMSSEMIEYTKNQILTQAGVSILSQANELPQQALQLLQ